MTNYFTRVWTLRRREAMTFDYIKRQIDIESSSQRIQEDIYRFAEAAKNLGSQVADTAMTLIASIPILWALSGHRHPGARQKRGLARADRVTVSIGGLAISWFAGIKLPGLEYNNQKAKAAFRKSSSMPRMTRQTTAHPRSLKGYLKI